MGTLTVYYSRSQYGAPIRAADRWGRWSHQAALLPGDKVVEARAFHGVVLTPRAEFEARVTYFERVDFEVPNPAAGYAWALEQVADGRPYNYRAIAANLLRLEYTPQPEHGFTCTQLVEDMRVRAGALPRFRGPTWRLSPNLSWAAIA